MSPRLNVQDYSHMPRFDVRGAVALGTALVSAIPPEAPASVKEAADEISQKLEALNSAWGTRGAARRESLRPYDQRLDAAWSALYGSIDAAAKLPGGRERSARAAELLDALFGDGLGFLTLRYDKEWAESDRILRKIHEEQLTPAIDAVTGSPEYLEEIEISHSEYGKALSITAPAEPAVVESSLRGPMEQLRTAMGDYAVQLVAWGNHRSGTNYEAARLALAPIDAARRAEARRSGGPSSNESAGGQSADEEGPDVEPQEAPSVAQTPGANAETEAAAIA